MIRRITAEDKELFYALSDEFYHSPAVEKPLKEGQQDNLWQALMEMPAIVRGFILEDEGRPCGYTIAILSYSTEGGVTLWLEDLYIRPEARGRGLGQEVMAFYLENFPKVRRFRLEVEDSNEKAVHIYQKFGFRFLDYREMIKDVE